VTATLTPTATPTIEPCTLDVDRDSTADELTDGVLVTRYLFGFTGTALVAGALSPNATRSDPAEIVDYLDGCRATMLDADGNGSATPLTDGLLVLRRLFGFSGEMLIDGAVAPTCSRCLATDIEAHLDSYLPEP
jgi:hypothetical protein